MALSDLQLLDALSRMPFVDSTELALILGEPHTTVHRALSNLLAKGTVGRVSHGTAYLLSSQRYHLTASSVREAADILGFDTPSDFVRAYPMSREWLTLLIRRMDAVAGVYRLAASLSPDIDGLRTRVEFQRRGRFDATITLHDGRDFGVVRQGLALRRRSLHDRLRAIAEYDYSRRPGAVLILVPSVWEERLTTRFCDDRNIDDCYIAVESRDALERRSSPGSDHDGYPITTVRLHRMCDEEQFHRNIRMGGNCADNQNLQVHKVGETSGSEETHRVWTQDCRQSVFGRDTIHVYRVV